MHAQFAEHGKVLGGLDPFADDHRAEVGGQRHEAADHTAAGPVPGAAVDQSPVDLDQVGFELDDVVQRGVTGARVVDRDPDALIPERPQLPAHSS